MNQQPPEQLVSLLGRLHLANRAQLLSVQRQVSRLARNLPQFESVWVDALAHARIITPFQAAEINAGRGQALAVGPFLLEKPLESSPWTQVYSAIDTRTRQRVRLTRAPCPPQRLDERMALLQDIVQRAAGIENEHVVLPRHCGAHENWLWVASDHVEATTALAWTVHHGRFPAEMVLEIARQMAEGLADLEAAGLIHGDVAAQSLLISKSGKAILIDSLLRGVARPEEGYAHADAPPEAYDYLAPERIANGSPPDVGSDLYACGCLWWHLLAGRPPLAGGNRLAKLQSAQAPRIGDICLLSPETPQPLASAIAGCLRIQPHHRPESFARLASLLGPSTKRDTASLAGLIRGDGPQRLRLRTTAATARHSRWTSVWMAASAGCVASLAITLWPQWSQQLPWQTARTVEAAAITATDTVDTKDRGTQHTAINPNGETFPLDETPSTSTPPDATHHVRQGSQQSVQAPNTALYHMDADGSLVLTADRPIHLERLSLSPGQIVTGQPGTRPQVVVPADGLSIDVDGVRFRGIDFIANPPRERSTGTMIRLNAEQAEFVACSFRGVNGGATVAIDWKLVTDSSTIDLPTGHITLHHCIFENVAVGVHCSSQAALSLSIINTLHLGWGPLIALDDLPRADAPISVFADRLTLRNAESFLECHVNSDISTAAPITIEAVQSIFAQRAGNPLVVFVGPKPKEDPWHMVQWSGQGTVLDSPLPLVGWRSETGEVTAADETRLNVSGVVRGSVEFAGPASRGPVGSRVVGWNAPLRSPDAPGFDPTPLVPRHGR